MKIKKGEITVLLSIFAYSFFVAHVLGLLTVENEDGNNDFNSASNIATIGNSSDHLMWFVQVSDLHLSQYFGEKRGKDLLDLCDITFKLINPAVILATGDLTDGRKQDYIGSTQLEEEWIMYKKILDNCSAVRNIPWLDIRGNHDNFDVPGVYSDKNLFLKYSMQGKNHSRSYVHKLTVGSDKYAFIAVDACPEVGIKMTFNFAGMMSYEEIERLMGFYHDLNDVNHTIWFGHYPTSSIITPPVIRNIIAGDRKSLAYLCGHLHTFFGYAPEMYTVQKSGFYELELGDWKTNRMYRVAAIDHGLFSFMDVRHNNWPVILVTNPKHALLQSRREPLDAMLSSTHIRLLVFSLDTSYSVKVRVDSGCWNTASHISGPLYTVPWEPSNYSTGIHNIEICVSVIGRGDVFVNHPFSLDGTRLDFKPLSKFLLMLNLHTTIQFVFVGAMLFYVLPFFLARFLTKRVLDGKMELEWLKRFSFWFKGFVMLVNIDALFYPIFLYPIYISIGPWAYAELVEGIYGWIFLWGIIINGTFIPETFTYAYALAQLIFFVVPIAICTGFTLIKRLNNPPVSNRKNKSQLLQAVNYFISALPFLIILMFQLMLSYPTYLAYGLPAALGPYRSWPIVALVWCCYHSKTVSIQTLRASASVWEKKKYIAH